MAYESIKVDIIPGSENAEVLHFSQYDNKRPFFIELFNGEDEFVPEAGMTITLECRKRDGNIVIISDPVMNDNVAEFSTTEQLTACYGDNMAEIKIVDDNDLVIGSANFIINVEKSPTCGGLVSESEIDNLTQQIEDIAQEVIGEDYYTKTQTDALLAQKADIEDLPDMSRYYTKLETNSLLSNYVETSYLTTNYYTRSDSRLIFVSKSELQNVMQLEGQASGSIATFETAAPAQRLAALKCNFLCSGGNGTPSTPIPLVPLTELNVINKDENDVTKDSITIDLDGTRYGGYVDANNGKLVVTHGYADLGDLSWVKIGMGGGRYGFRAGISDMALTPAANEKINAVCECYSIDTGNNVYLGTVGMAGWGVSTYDIAVYDDTLESGDATAFKTAMSGMELAYELATPIEVDIFPEYLNAHQGVNNVFHDGNGTTEVRYKDTIQHYIDSRV